MPTAPENRPAGGLFRKLNDHLNLHSIVERKPRHTDSRSRVLADRLAKNLHHQVGKSIYYFRLVTKAFGGVDHAKDFDHAFNAIQATNRSAHLGQHDQPNLTRRVITFL